MFLGGKRAREKRESDESEEESGLHDKFDA
jgi:hypothetical protein